MRLAIVGGSDAGIEAARRARDLDTTAEVTVLVADAYPNYSICGLPYYLAGDVPDWRSLAHRSRDELEATGMQPLLGHRVTAIDADAKHLTTRRPDGSIAALEYDRLILATGAVPIRPPIEGLGLDGVHLLHIAMRWTADRATRRLLGCQLVGHQSAQVAKRIDLPAAALHAGWTIDHISDLDLSSSPPFGSPWDVLQIGSQAWTRSIDPTGVPVEAS
jgi:NADPH-dependent 2,4-dienoyl-CoA reductase/sulfur reductase-like enzyme